MEDERELTIGSITGQYPRAVKEPDVYRFVVETQRPTDGGWVDNVRLFPNKSVEKYGDYDFVVGVGVSRQTGETVTLPESTPLNGYERMRPDVNHSS